MQLGIELGATVCKPPRQRYLQPIVNSQDTRDSLNMNDKRKPTVASRANRFAKAIPYTRALALTVENVSNGWAELSMPYRRRLVGDFDTGIVDGGAVSALLDSCAGTAVLAHPQVFSGTATLNLRIDYMRPATPGQTIRARAKCYHVARTVAFVRAKAFDDDPDKPVATAVGAFTVATASK